MNRLTFLAAMRNNFKHLSLKQLIKYKVGVIVPIPKKDLEAMRKGAYFITRVSGESFQIKKVS